MGVDVDVAADSEDTAASDVADAHFDARAGCPTGAARAGLRLRSAWRELVDRDACGRGAGGQRERGGAQFGQVAAVDGERTDLADPALIDVQEAAVGAEPGVDAPDAASLADRGADEQGQRAIGGDLVAGG